MKSPTLRSATSRWVPWLMLAISLAVTGVAASYARHLVRNQDRAQRADHDRFRTAMQRVADELQSAVVARGARIPADEPLQRVDIAALAARAIDAASLRTLRIRLYATLDTSAAGLIYDSNPQANREAHQPLRTGTAIDALGTPWALMVDARPAFGATGDIDPVPTVLVAGALLALLIFASTLARGRAERRAKDTETRYHELFNGTPIPMWLYDRESLRIVAVNDAAVAHYGYSREQFHARTIVDLRPADEVPALLHAVARQQMAFHDAGVWRHQKRDGTIIDVAIAAHALDFNGRPCEVVVAHDISGRRRAEAAVRESDERFRQMANHIKEAFFVVDLQSDVPLYVSPTWGEIWGRPMSESTDPDIWFEAIHPDDRVAMRESQAAIRRGEPSEQVFRVMRPDRTIRWVRGRSFPVRNSRGEIYRMVGVSEDITELRAIETRLAQSQKMEAIGRLAGGVAHDFNNLLTVILAEADDLQRVMEPSTCEAQSVQEIRLAGERAAQLTRQLLAFSRQQLVAPVVFDLTAAVGDMGNMLRRLIGGNIALVTRLPSDTWTPKADPGQIEQVLANLVVNARDAMPGGGTLTIETANIMLDAEDARANDVRPGEYVTMIVRDSGCGMTEAVRARLFEPFFTTKEMGCGTGLGLATSYGIVKQADGHIAVESDPGLGTTVTVYLPRGQAQVPVVPPAAVRALPRGSETILVVEDEAAVRRITVRVLEAQGYTLLEAGDGVEAARVVASHRGNIELLLTDVVLPGLGGREIAERARAQRPGIKVLFASGYTDDVILQHRLLDRGVELLHKPFSRESMARKVREVLDAPAA